MDLSSITVQDQEEDNTAVDDIEPINEDIIVHARIEENLDDPEEIAATPTLPAPTRNVFNLTNIREESTLLEDSVMADAMEETLLTPRDEMEAVQEENSEDLENILEPNVSNTRFRDGIGIFGIFLFTCLDLPWLIVLLTPCMVFALNLKLLRG